MAALILFAASLLGGFIFPWWWPAVAAYAVGFWKPRRAGAAFLSGFAGPALAWAGLAAWMDQRNHHLLSARIAALFHAPDGWALIAATGVIGGMMGGLGAWAGFSLRAYARPHKPLAAVAPATEAPEGGAPDPDAMSESSRTDAEPEAPPV
jgi:hypothetical protein